MAVMLTQWSPVPWSGETVPRPALPPPSAAVAPTPIYETLLREWSQAGRTVPGHGRHGPSEPVESPGRWWRTDDPRPSYGSYPSPPPVPAPAAAPLHTPAPEPGPPAPLSPEDVRSPYRGGTYGGHSDPYGSSASYGSYGSPASYGAGSVGAGAAPYVSGYGDGGGDVDDHRRGPGSGSGAAGDGDSHGSSSTTRHVLPAQTAGDRTPSSGTADDRAPAQAQAQAPAPGPAPVPASDAGPDEKRPAWERVRLL